MRKLTVSLVLLLVLTASLFASHLFESLPTWAQPVADEMLAQEVEEMDNPNYDWGLWETLCDPLISSSKMKASLINAGLSPSLAGYFVDETFWARMGLDVPLLKRSNKDARKALLKDYYNAYVWACLDDMGY